MNIEKQLNSITNKFLEKINSNNNTFIIFGLDSCGYCKKSIQLAREKNIQFKYYNVEKYYDVFIPILEKLNKLNINLNINPLHKTFPVIFYNGKFLGGYTELSNYL